LLLLLLDDTYYLLVVVLVDLLLQALVSGHAEVICCRVDGSFGAQAAVGGVFWSCRSEAGVN